LISRLSSLILYTMNQRKRLLALLLGVSILFSGCTTYHLSTQSLLEQFANSGTEKKTTILIVAPYFFFPGSVKGNDLTSIVCQNNKGNAETIVIAQRTAIRITKTDGSRTTFYFNTLIIKDSTITGSKSDFFNVPIKPIKLEDIAKLEVQK
jgi:hypothetical protein